ncbi:MAG: VOC family protein [Microvirga sp.]
MPVIGLDHLQLAMPPGGEPQAKAFYEGLLGLHEVPKPPHLAARGGCWFQSGTVKVHLGVEKEFRPARKAHPGFIVDDLANLLDRLEQAGFAAIDDEPLDGFVRNYVSDPFGNRIELMQRV